MAAPMRKSVELFYDVVSPYSWIAFEVLCRYRSKWNIDLKLKPFFLGGVMQTTGNRPPAMVPNKGKYMFRDIQRLRNYYAVPMNLPEASLTADEKPQMLAYDQHLHFVGHSAGRDLYYANTYHDIHVECQHNFAEVMFEKGSLSAQRFITAIDMENPEFTEAVSRSLWMRIWNKDVPITDPENFVEAGKTAGLSDDIIQRAVSKIKSQEVKDRLKAQTDEALKYGAFGAPTIMVDVNGKKEMFFGNDRFPIMAEIIGEKWHGPLKELSKCKL